MKLLILLHFNKEKKVLLGAYLQQALGMSPGVTGVSSQAGSKGPPLSNVATGPVPPPFPAKCVERGPPYKIPLTPILSSANQTSKEGALGEGLMPLPSLLSVAITPSTPL